MLACLVAAHSVFGMHAVGQHDINDVNVRVVFDRIVILVVVDVLLADAVTKRELVGFIGMTAYQCNDFRLLTLSERGKYLIDRETTQADDGPPQLVARRVRDSELRGSGLQ